MGFIDAGAAAVRRRGVAAEVRTSSGSSRSPRTGPLNGFGTPYFVYLLYVVKVALYAVGGLLVISATTSDLGGLGNLGDWWTEPIVFQKAVVWTMLWEILGLGAGSLPLTLRFKPMIGGVLYWLRPGTTRLPPWPERVPFTRGTERTILDVGLYAGVLAWLLYLLLTDGVSTTTDLAGRLDPAAVGSLLILLGLLGLRDKVPFLAARAEIYGTLMIIFLFPLTQHDRRRPARLRLHLVGGGLLEAEPPLPLRGHGDDQQHPLEPVARR